MGHLERLAVVLVSVAAGCSAATGPRRPSASPGAAPAATLAASLPPAAATIEAYGEDPQSYFAPAKVDVTAGDVLRVVDAGDTLHDFTVDVGGTVPTTRQEQHIAFQIKVDLVTRTAQSAITLPPGTYRFYCSVGLGDGSGHAINGMVGTITVH